ncbi:hypothetical protein GCM10018987_58180 [Streptomyces cremeus]
MRLQQRVEVRGLACHAVEAGPVYRLCPKRSPRTGTHGVPPDCARPHPATGLPNGPAPEGADPCDLLV